MVNKTKQEEEFIARLLNGRLGSSWLWEKGVQGFLQTKIFYGVNAEVIWLFQLIGCLAVFFLIWIRVA